MAAETLDETADYIALRRLQNQYADICSRQAWPELHDLFLPEATVTLDLRNRDVVLEGPQAVGDFIAAQLVQFSFFQFVIRNSVIDFSTAADGTAGAASRLWMSEFRQHADDGHWSTIFGLYQDRYVHTPDGWRIARRRYQSIGRPDTGEAFAPDDRPFEDF